VSFLLGHGKVMVLYDQVGHQDGCVCGPCLENFGSHFGLGFVNFDDLLG
jgi:hypothetical protein